MEKSIRNTHIYVLNMSNIIEGHFTVYSQLYLNLHLKLKAVGYELPEQGNDNHRVRPHITVGRAFHEYLRKKILPRSLDVEWVPFYKEDGTVDLAKTANYQYPIRFLPDFMDFYEKSWLPGKAADYFKRKAPEALEYLPFICKTWEEVQQEIARRAEMS
jgi:hypothetical protein